MTAMVEAEGMTRRAPAALTGLGDASARRDIISLTVWGLGGCRQISPLRTNRSVRSGFSGSTVLLASRCHLLSFYTTVGGSGDVLLKDIRSTHRYVLNTSLS